MPGTTMRVVRARAVRHVVVFMHRPLFVRPPAERSRGAAPAPGRTALAALLDAHPAKVTVFSGHLHQRRCVCAADIDQVISGPVGFPLRGESGYRTVSVADGAVEHRYEAFTLS